MSPGHRSVPPGRQKILVVTDDALGEKMAGPAIRAWNIAEVLARQHDVRLASTLRAEASSPDFAVCDGSPENLPGIAAGMDVIVTQGFTLFYRPWLADVGAKMVVDLYDPIHLETLEGEAGEPGSVLSPSEADALHQRRVDGCISALQVQIEVGDFFLCASERQRDLWLGHLSALGRVNVKTYRQDTSLRTLIDVAPFGIAETPPGNGPAIKGVVDGIAEGDTVLLWAGGVYNWFDPVTLVNAVGDLVDTHPRLRLFFMGTKHPSLDDISTTVLRQAIAVAQSRDLLGTHVFFREGWVPYDRRGDFLTDADIGVSTHFLHVETAFSFRTRMLDYLWAGLPIVCTEGDEFARLVQTDGLGRVVKANDTGGLATALRELLDDPAAMTAARNAVQLTAPQFHWRRALQPLVDYCAAPYLAADKGSGHRPIGRGAAWGGRFDRQLAHVREYISVNGWGRLVRRGAQRVVGRAVRPVRRLISG